MTLEEEMLQLKARNQFLENQVALLLPFKEKSEQLETVVNQLLARVQKLEQQLKTNSRNSSKPPSSDSFNRPPKNRSLRQKSGKNKGGQPDQQGHQLTLTDQPDQIVRYAPQHCHNCQASLTDLAATQLRLKEQRQVWDVPPLKVQVTEHQTLECVCPHYAWHSKRGKQATDAIGILVNYRGISVHDSFTSYPQYQCDHALCNAHHLRELIFVHEQLGQAWASDFMALLLELKEAVRAAREAGAVALLPEQLATYYQRYDQLIACGLEANPPPIAETVAVKQGRPKTYWIDCKSIGQRYYVSPPTLRCHSTTIKPSAICGSCAYNRRSVAVLGAQKGRIISAGYAAVFRRCASKASQFLRYSGRRLMDKLSYLP